MYECKSLEIIPNLAKVTSLRDIEMRSCKRLRSFPESIRHCSRIERVYLTGCTNLKTFPTHLPTSIRVIYLGESNIERITDGIKDLHTLILLILPGCKSLVSLPELPCSLNCLDVSNCESLEEVRGPLNIPNAEVDFTNCFKLDGEARKAIIQRSFVNGFTLLPGKEVPAEFDYQARGNSLTIPHSNFDRFKVCVVVSPGKAGYDEDTDEVSDNEFKVSKPLCRRIDIDVPEFYCPERLKSEHLLIFHHSLPFLDRSQVRTKTVLHLNGDVFEHLHILKCGIQMLTEETDGNNNREDESEEASDEEEEEKLSDKDDNESESNESSDEEDEEDGSKSE